MKNAAGQVRRLLAACMACAAHWLGTGRSGRGGGPRRLRAGGVGTARVVHTHAARQCPLRDVSFGAHWRFAMGPVPPPNQSSVRAGNGTASPL